ARRWSRYARGDTGYTWCSRGETAMCPTTVCVSVCLCVCVCVCVSVCVSVWARVYQCALLLGRSFRTSLPPGGCLSPSLSAGGETDHLPQGKISLQHSHNNRGSDLCCFCKAFIAECVGVSACVSECLQN